MLPSVWRIDFPLLFCIVKHDSLLSSIQIIVRCLCVNRYYSFHELEWNSCRLTQVNFFIINACRLFNQIDSISCLRWILRYLAWLSLSSNTSMICYFIILMTSISDKPSNYRDHVLRRSFNRRQSYYHIQSSVTPLNTFSVLRQEVLIQVSVWYVNHSHTLLFVIREKGGYLRQGYKIVSHGILWDAITYPCLR